ncbi:MAG: hypothetical protein GC190_10890 [Alphaproteobacteria bacterium]|nr:hypothetical protein [Alphaproteobacteria bacterium]
MSATRKKLAPAALGLRAIRGGAVVVGVTLARREPAVVLSSFLSTGAADDRLSFEPYHVAAEMARAKHAKAEIAAAVTEGRKRQNKLAAKGLADLVAKLGEKDHEPAVAALLVNRAGWIDDLLSYSLAWPDHPPVAEGLAVREALRFAIGRAGVAIAEVDEKSLPDLAPEVLDLKPAALDARLKALGAAAKPWRKEQKLACLAAWVQLARMA